MVWLKSCPRCSGDIFLERNIGESYMMCLQCGHVLTAAQESRLKETRARRQTPVLARS